MMTIPSDLALTKKQLRRRLLKQRQAMPLEVWQKSCDRICTHIATTPLFQAAHTVLAYHSHRREPTLTGLWQQDRCHRWGFPRCVGMHLSWHLCDPLNPNAFQQGAYGLVEPQTDQPLLQAQDIDLILIPCIAVSEAGFRLGYGGGFYDRLLSTPAWREIPTIGITFDFAHLPQLPTEPWDLPLQTICTESGTTLIGKI